ncbi:MAG: protein translocase subunit SecD, partial [Pseudomonadota bacterium]
MLYFSKWKIISILLVVLAGFTYSAPNLLSEKQANALPDWLPHAQMTLGLDLKGGAHLLMQVDEEKLIAERLDALRDDVRVKLREADARGRARSQGDRSVVVRLNDPAQTAAMQEAMRELLQPTSTGVLDGFGITEISESNPSEGELVYTLTDEGIENRVTRAITQSISVFGERLNEFGTTEPIIQREGVNRVLVQYPGLDASEIPRLKALLSTEAVLSFHPVSNAADPDTLLNQGRTPPPGTRVFFEDSDPPIPYLLRTRPLIKGDQLTEASSGFDQRSGEPMVFFRFNAAGSQIFARFTSENVGRPFAIVLDDTVLSAPVINEPIIGGSGQISGNFTPQTANDLAVLLSAGALPASFEFVEERTVGPGLGADSIAAGLNASIVGAILVLVFMIVAYGLLGVIANLALIANISMLIAILSILGATLTLPGIAGIVLTMGMAVDANVLIYERIREERRNGRNLIQSFDAGFRSAFTTILDANVTTLIAAIILFYLGSGPVRGFAVTLAVGVLTTVFTAYTFTRLLVSLWVRYTKPKELPSRMFGILPENTSIAFMRFRSISFAGSAMAIIASVVMFFTLSLNYGIDFKGGTLFEVRLNDGATIEEPVTDIRSKMSELNLG